MRTPTSEFPLVLGSKAETCRTHCCLAHGCKYGYDDCAVVESKVEQAHGCQYCDYDEEDRGITFPTYRRMLLAEKVLSVSAELADRPDLVATLEAVAAELHLSEEPEDGDLP